MPERIPRLGSTATAGRRNGQPQPNRSCRNPASSSRSTRATKVTPKTSDKMLLRSASNPVLWHTQQSFNAFSSAPMLPPPPPPSAYTTNPSAEEEAKVVVSVTVEGSPGPVRALVRLGATVDEAIGVVMDIYGKEGRSPKLERKKAGSFQLHHSHFSLQGIDKSDKIGKVGGRSFYLRKSSGDDYFNFRSREGRNAIRDNDENKSLNSRYNPVILTRTFFSFIDIRRLCKFRRRIRKIWSVFICITCG